MITNDTALEVARLHLGDEIRRGGLVTLYGFDGYWVANCTFPAAASVSSGKGHWVVVERDGSVRPYMPQR